MSSVTERIKQIKQPRGGYIKPSQFYSIPMGDINELSEVENVHPSVIGMVIDYMTRFMMGEKVEKAFRISIIGAALASELSGRNTDDTVQKLLADIKGIDDLSIINACKMVTFDVWRRNPRDAITAKTAEDINPNADTIRNIRIMIQRSLSFWEKFGPIIKSGFTFGRDGYTSVIDSGDGDYLTSNTIWDFKVSKSKPTSKNTLQLLIYWIMGQHSGNPIFNNIDQLGIYNPRLDITFLLNISKVPDDVIQVVENDIICY